MSIGGGVPVAVIQQGEAVVQPLGQLVDREDAEPDGGQFHRQRHAVQATTQFSDLLTVLLGHLEAGGNRPRTRDQHLHRGMFQDAGEVIGRAGTDSGGSS